MLQAPLPPTRTDSPVRTIQQQSGDTASENVELAVLHKCLCDGELTQQPDLQSGSPKMMCDLACDRITENIRAGQTSAVSGRLRNARTCHRVVRSEAAR